MKIHILESIACSVNGTHGPGDIVDWKPEADAKSLIKQGIAKAHKNAKFWPKRYSRKWIWVSFPASMLCGA